ncbi:hypothetical protein ZEAMMB73_Zm00001d040985 [Zea mays]|uniref:Uncharacterized protein n=1 Tax=Zea mays TaxID=4577 RepID=A0A1D6MTP5_MAIZE|nr:hypothetical protein ZEAMMB73_Zm00001d040985 [Zea mays]
MFITNFLRSTIMQHGLSMNLNTISFFYNVFYFYSYDSVVPIGYTYPC